MMRSGVSRRSARKPKWKSQLFQIEGVDVHSSAIVHSWMGIQLNESPEAGGNSVTGDSVWNSEVLAMLSLKVNRRTFSVDVEPETPLLWVIRDTIGLTGTKFSCGKALCGACTVHVNGKPVRSCVVPTIQVVGQEITTIEGLSPNAQHPAQIAWREGDVPECGYCQSGQIMAAAALLSKKPNPTDADIEREITNLCRCGTYLRIRQAIHRAAQIAARV